MAGSVLLREPSLAMSTTILGFTVPAGNVYLWRAVRRVAVSSTRMSVDCDGEKMKSEPGISARAVTEYGNKTHQIG